MVDENIEKSLKRFLKRKVSVNESVVVKFLITGLIGTTLTACGGGGGGGGSSSGGVTPLPPVEPKPPIVKPEKPQVSKPVEDLVLGNTEINGENVVIQGNEKENNFSESGKSAISVVNNSKVTNESNLKVSGENATAISAVNSTVDNKANITLSGEGATALKGEVDTVLRNKAFEISIQNNGTIDLEGRRNIGLLILSKSGLISGMNNGTINANNGFEIDDSPENEVFDNKFLKEYLKDYSFGMVGVGDGSKITNSSNGTINVNGSSIGMYTKNGTAINEGTINIESNIPNDGKEYKAPIGMMASGNGTVTNNATITGSGNGDIQGMFAYNGGTAINGKDGKINLDGEFATALNGINGTVINDGSITVNNGNGIEIFGGSATNNGTIKLTGNYVRGISSENGNATNNKDILIEGSNSAGLYAGLDDTIPPKEVSLINDTSGKINIKGDFSSGIENHCSSYKLSNKGLIDVTGANTHGIYSFGDNVAIKNNGDINLKFDISNFDSNYSENIGISSEGNNNTIENNGNIKLDLNGSNSKVARLDNSGISVEGINNTIKNNGKIEISGNINQNFSDWIDFSGIKSYGYTEGKNESLIENGKDGEIIIDIKNPLDCKNITVMGINSTLDDTTVNNLGSIAISGAKNATGIMGNNGIITNKKSGVIELSGDYVTGIRGTNSQITNDGDILITSKNLGGYPNNGEQHSTGIYLGENDGTATVKNSGNIIMNGNRLTGIYAYNGTITNEKGGKISVTGDMGTGLYISGQTSGSAINNGEITVNGNDSDGMLAELNTTATNKGTITVIGDNISGMTSDQGANLINDFDGIINLNGGNSNGLVSHNDNTTIDNLGDINLTFNDSEFTLGEYSNVTGILINGNNNIVKNNGKIEILGNIDLPYDKDSKTCYFYGIRSNDEIGGTNNTITNDKNGKIIININKTVENANIYANGIHSNFAGTTINNLGEISISGVNDSMGIYGYNSIINNSGKITVNGGNNYGIRGNEGSTITNTGTIELNGYFAWGIDEGIPSFEKKTIINNSGEIKINGSNGIGINAPSNSEITNLKDGNISITGDYGIGIKGGNSQIANNGNIHIMGADIVGITAEGKSSIINNDGKIYLKGDTVTGIDTEKSISKVVNRGEIFVENTAKYQPNGKWVGATGIIVSGVGSEGINEVGGTITVVGDNGRGMEATNGATVTNKGTIKVSGNGSFGMVANGKGSNALNEGTIEIGAVKKGETVGGGMFAYGGTVTNNGTIIIDSSFNVDENSKNSFAITASQDEDGNMGVIENYGNIETKGNATIKAPNMNAFVIGTNSDGSYGKVSAENISVDGNVKVSTEIVKGSYKDSYILDDVMTGKTELKENYKLSTTSVLYGASSKVDEKGNLDVKLSKENKFSDFASKEYGSLAGVLDEALNKKDLSANAKKVLDSVFASSTTEENLRNRLKEISGVEYTNIARQIFDTKDIFKSYDNSIINTLDNYQFNFNFIGNYSDVEAKGNLLGYESQMTGISGAMKFNDSLYGVIGYGYNDIDFDGKSEGNIKSVHTGIYKDMKLNSFDVRLGVFGEYNFHEVERNITNEIAKGDFNSYLLGACGEISQRFGDSLYVKPALSLDVTYGRYEDFTEDGAEEFNLTVDSQDYTSIVPAIEVKVGKDFEMASIYSTVKFGYEFGDMNKLQYAKLGNLETPLPFTDEIENAQTDVKVGTAFEINNFTFNAEVGKEFGKGDREYITAGFTYTF